MKNIKDITISIFAILGFVFVLTSFTSNGTQETQQVVYTTPETHVWEFHLSNPSASASGNWGKDGMAFAINKVTGEVRKYESHWGNYKNQKWGTLTISSKGN